MARLVVLAGLPGSGKSTLLRGICAAIPGAVSLDIDDVMPEELRARMSSGLPITPEQREGLMALLHTTIAHQLAANPHSVLVAGLVLVAERHRESLLALSPAPPDGGGAVLLTLECPLSTLVARLAARAASAPAHFFNPAAIEALHARLEPVVVPHVKVDAMGSPEEVLAAVVAAIGR
jgi:gluconate kinase